VSKTGIFDFTDFSSLVSSQRLTDFIITFTNYATNYTLFADLTG